MWQVPPESRNDDGVYRDCTQKKNDLITLHRPHSFPTEVIFVTHLLVRRFENKIETCWTKIIGFGTKTMKSTTTSALRSALIKLVILCFWGSVAVVVADWGDYVDPTFQCPAMTPCQQVCVTDESECPEEMLCQDEALTLCADGSCAEECDETLESPCLYECAYVACVKIIDYHDLCYEKYGTFYEYEAECGAEESAYEMKLYSYTELIFLCFYFWISGLTVVVIAWSAFNQRLFPVAGSTKPLVSSSESTEESLMMKDMKEAEESAVGNIPISYQTGYTIHPIGWLIATCVIITLVGIQALLAFLTIQYYVNQQLIKNLKLFFESDVQALTVFIIVWSKSKNEKRTSLWNGSGGRVSYPCVRTHTNTYLLLVDINNSGRISLDPCLQVALFNLQHVFASMPSQQSPLCGRLRTTITKGDGKCL